MFMNFDAMTASVGRLTLDDAATLKIYASLLSDIGNTTLDSRLRGGPSAAYDSYSPHHNSTLAAAGHHMGTATSKLLNRLAQYSIEKSETVSPKSDFPKKERLLFGTWM